MKYLKLNKGQRLVIDYEKSKMIFLMDSVTHSETNGRANGEPDGEQEVFDVYFKNIRPIRIKTGLLYWLVNRLNLLVFNGTSEIAIGKIELVLEADFENARIEIGQLTKAEFRDLKKEIEGINTFIKTEIQ
jgi:hypothetical protein